jgi:hypothetical protein
MAPPPAARRCTSRWRARKCRSRSSTSSSRCTRSGMGEHYHSTLSDCHWLSLAVIPLNIGDLHSNLAGIAVVFCHNDSVAPGYTRRCSPSAPAASSARSPTHRFVDEGGAVMHEPMRCTSHAVHASAGHSATSLAITHRRSSTIFRAKKSGRPRTGLRRTRLPRRLAAPALPAQGSWSHSDTP